MTDAPREPHAVAADPGALMNPRQAHALTHPITDPTRDDVGPYRQQRRHATGLLLVTILAVDR